MLLVTLLSTLALASTHEPPRRLADWDQALGNHRATVAVRQAADAVRVHLLWRRRDASPETKQLLVVPAAGSGPVQNVVPVRIARLEGDIVFQPTAGAGDYYVYTMPFKIAGSPYFPNVTYPSATYRPDVAWLTRNHLTASDLAAGAWKRLTSATVVAFEDRGAFNRYDAMELIAGPAETAGLLAQHPSGTFFLFPESRAHPIKMSKDLPERWIERGPDREVVDTAKRGEFVSFQAGIWAARAEVNRVQLKFGLLRDARGHIIPAAAFRCFNTGGVDWVGHRFKKRVDVKKGCVASMWCGVQVPTACHPGAYQGTVAVSALGLPTERFGLRLTVTSGIARDHGDSDPRRLSRLRWLDSKIGLDDQVVAPYKPLRLTGNSVSCLGRSVRFGSNGLPAGIRVGATEILARPIELVALEHRTPLTWRIGANEVVARAPGVVKQLSRASAGPLRYKCRSKMEADGYVNFQVSVSTTRPIRLDDTRLVIPIRRTVATYMMGMGRKGGYRPKSWHWDWSNRNANNMVWIGDVDAGLQCKLKDVDETWDLFKLAHLPDAWYNHGLGGCRMAEDGSGDFVVTAYSGARNLAAGQALEFNFGLLVTPVKPLDPAHWNWRYDHEYIAPETAKARGATIINIHQGNPLNPNINYPFVAADKLKAYVQKAHRLGLKVKIYYTVRELSDRVEEMWALRSLGREVFRDGPGGGDPWLQEHFVDHYTPAWRTPLADGSTDAAIATVGLSRWHNYYLEGLRWLVQNVGIDGLYLDGIGYDREIMKRVRKVMDRAKPGCLIDFHCGNSFAPQYGMNSPANQFMEHFPYMSSLWLGEGFDYNESPDYWLVEVSGLPFGMYGEMLEGNGNPWRGMVYGMTARFYSGANPQPIWELWDRFGIAESKMLGYWSKACPVRTDNPNVLATAYVRKGRALIALASWNKTPVNCRLEINWKAIGLDRSQVTINAPDVKGFQPATRFGVDEEIPVQPGKGWMIVVSQASTRGSG